MTSISKQKNHRLVVNTKKYIYEALKLYTVFLLIYCSIE